MGAPRNLLREEARAMGSIRYFTGKPCVRGHIVERLVSNNCCVVCGRNRVKQWQKANPEIAATWMVAARKRYEEKNRDKVLESKRRYRERNREKVRMAGVEYGRQHAARRSAYKKQWRKEKPWLQAANERARVARRFQATPVWADADAIEAIYAEAARLTRETGIQYSVDHFYPLRGANVCGLHVEENLRVITLAENLKKGRRVPSSV